MSFSDMFALVRALYADKKGVTAIEYGVLAACIIVVCIGAVQLIGTNLGLTFASISGAL